MELRPDVTARTAASSRQARIAALNREDIFTAVACPMSGQCTDLLPTFPAPTYQEVPPAGRRTVRHLLIAAVLLLLALPLSGCAATLRFLAAAEGAVAVGEALGDRADRAVPSVSGSRVVHAVVSGTGGSGLRLNGRPGADRLAVLPDGAVVTSTCLAAGPQVDGPRGSTSTWIKVRTSDGRRGFMSAAYLVLDTAEVAPC